MTPGTPRPTRSCSRCGATLAAETTECPHCLLLLGIEPEPAAPPESAAGARGPRPGPPPTLAEVRAAFPALEIESLLGQGGMGAVFRARQPRLQRNVALKVLPRSLADDPDFAQRFGREARTLARLSHPGIVTVHDFGCADGLHFLVMELVDGVNLRTLLQQGPLDPRQALTIARELCDALQYAHDEGVVHRDIKPENVLVDARGKLKVADFGLAKLVDSGAEAVLTRGDQVMGTPHYMAPEQLERPLEVDHRADLFALGVVLYEMLTGSLPRGKFEPPSRRVRVDVQLDHIVLKALEHEPMRRYQHALEIKSDVEHVADDGRPRPAPAPPRTAGPTPPPATRRRSVREALAHPRPGWRAAMTLGLAWILLGVSWNLGPFAAGLGIVVLVGAFWSLLVERVRAVGGWSEALRRSPTGERFERRFVLLVGAPLCVLAIVLGHVVHWENGVHTWQPVPRGGVDALFEWWSRDPWALLRCAVPAGRVHEFVEPASQPRVVMESNASSLARESAPLAWILILGGFVGLGVVLARMVHVKDSPELGARAWRTGAELAAHGLGALLVLWLGAPFAALRSHQVLQEVASEFVCMASEEEAVSRLRSACAAQGLEIEVEQHVRVIEHRAAKELATAVFVRAASPDPFERWSTSFSGPVRETPRLWATLCPLLDGSGTAVKIRAGLFDPRTPQVERVHGVLATIERGMQTL